jgi:DNA-binding GntR family transcriptional regulator
MSLPDIAEFRPPGGHRTLAEGAVESLHAAIVTGVLPPGERLPIEEIARVLDLSPMPVREALHRLDSVGLVEHVPHRGARVTELSVDDLRDVYEARLALEQLAVWHAAEVFTDENAAIARDALAAHVKAYRSRDLRLVWSTHTDFHFALYNATRSRWRERLITPLWETSERYRFAMLPVRLNLDKRRSEHERILEACIAHEPQIAAAELYNHLARTANLISEQMDAAQLFPLIDVPSITKTNRHPRTPIITTV